MFQPLPTIVLSSFENPQHRLVLSTDEHILNPIVELYGPIDASAPNDDPSSIVSTPAERWFWQMIHPGSFDRCSIDENLEPWGWAAKVPGPSFSGDERLQELKEELIQYARTTHGRREAESVIAKYESELFEDCTSPEDFKAAEEYRQDIKECWEYCKDMEVFDEQYVRKTKPEGIRDRWEDQGAKVNELVSPISQPSIHEPEKTRAEHFDDLKNELRDRSKTQEGRAATEALLQCFKGELYESRDSPTDIKAAEDYLKEIEILWETFKAGSGTEGPQKRALNLWPSRKLATIEEEDEDKDDGEFFEDFEDDDENALIRSFQASHIPKLMIFTIPSNFAIFF
ncbi:uncharacterized protein BDZ99DRAFT_496181 [Mytilinidion resinicola]|uniref:Uncharacterized protein n=1 Tax=Mytilinidion resinicola TaxID=574789 RepID=A0A6A6YWG0_9PEZI|nr:uncharacterized protein BDZ99DRAFT_496181 [Mytilinidion resinicola]KAF2813110.1 hypothetical protein BDZ99DRAFT_496181 [Mytilinidion resinicola]